MADLTFAENRFGLGPRGNAREAVRDPRGWAAAQLTRFQPQLAGIPSRVEVAEGLADYLAMQREARMERRDMTPATAPAMRDSTMTPADISKPEARRQRDPEVRMARRENREDYARLVAARVNAALVSETPILERMGYNLERAKTNKEFFEQMAEP